MPDEEAEDESEKESEGSVPEGVRECREAVAVLGVGLLLQLKEAWVQDKEQLLRVYADTVALRLLDSVSVNVGTAEGGDALWVLLLLRLLLREKVAVGMGDVVGVGVPVHVAVSEWVRVPLHENVAVPCTEPVPVGDREGVEVPALIVRVQVRVADRAADAVTETVAAGLSVRVGAERENEHVAEWLTDAVSDRVAVLSGDAVAVQVRLAVADPVPGVPVVVRIHVRVAVCERVPVSDRVDDLPVEGEGVGLGGVHEREWETLLRLAVPVQEVETDHVGEKLSDGLREGEGPGDSVAVELTVQVSVGVKVALVESECGDMVLDV